MLSIFFHFQKDREYLKSQLAIDLSLITGFYIFLKILGTCFQFRLFQFRSLKQEEYQGYVTELMSSESKDYAYNEDMKAIRAEERMLSDSEDSAGAFGG